MATLTRDDLAQLHDMLGTTSSRLHALFRLINDRTIEYDEYEAQEAIAALSLELYALSQTLIRWHTRVRQALGESEPSGALRA